jgi:hypothetical protein
MGGVWGLARDAELEHGEPLIRLGEQEKLWFLMSLGRAQHQPSFPQALG